jgi:hypothetical protein
MAAATVSTPMVNPHVTIHIEEYSDARLPRRLTVGQYLFLGRSILPLEYPPALCSPNRAFFP